MSESCMVICTVEEKKNNFAIKRLRMTDDSVWRPFIDNTCLEHERRLYQFLQKCALIARSLFRKVRQIKGCSGKKWHKHKITSNNNVNIEDFQYKEVHTFTTPCATFPLHICNQWKLFRERFCENFPSVSPYRLLSVDSKKLWYRVI